ncbi:MAG: hypothetical protein U1E27_09815, partial [Kiritimatiellia bacterium]|nr:hypothetical protein [Kiritimatiellia bacterium]
MSERGGGFVGGNAYFKGGSGDWIGGDAFVVGGDSALWDVQFGGRVVIQGGASGENTNGADILLIGGNPGPDNGANPQRGKIRVSGDMILSNNLTMVSGTIRISPAGDLSMGN